MGPADVQFISKVGLRVTRFGEHVHTLGPAVPVVVGAREVQVGVPEFDAIIFGRPGLQVGREAQRGFQAVL